MFEVTPEMFAAAQTRLGELRGELTTYYILSEVLEAMRKASLPKPEPVHVEPVDDPDSPITMDHAETVNGEAA